MSMNAMNKMPRSNSRVKSVGERRLWKLRYTQTHQGQGNEIKAMANIRSGR